MLDSHKPLILLLGDIDHEGVTSKITSTGGQYKKKLLNSSVDNWKSILKLFDEFSISQILIKLTPYTYELINSESYRGVAEKLFDKISEFPNIVFVYEFLFSGIKESSFESQNNKSQFYIDSKSPEPITRLFVNEILESNNLNIIVYKKNAELTILALTFIEQIEQNLLFRIYVPSNRIWSLETDKLLQLFRDYLSKVSNLNISLDQYRTNQGTIFEFHGDENIYSANISKEFDDFSKFLDICISNPNSAEVLLQNKDLSPRAIYEIVERYSKEAKRLIVDIKQERERKLLGVQHRLESELADIVPPNFDWQVVNMLVDSVIPRLDGISSVLGIYQSFPQITSPLTVNINPQIFNKVEGIVAQEITGDISFNENISKLLELIQKHGNNKSAELTSAVYELADKSASNSGRLTARQKLKKFLLRIGDSGTLQAYVESQFGL
ncbi:hypothetical protein ACSQ6I_03235 [Anabaena sp. WFMT]|uniref:hypothetical protein n=1 Tax=Anabaena sp. WFMT TaxID=3449730 RepID=UPI003F26AED9